MADPVSRDDILTGRAIYNRRTQTHEHRPPEIQAFLDAYAALCRQHGFAFSHEDIGGAFVIELVTDDLLDWARDAMLGETASAGEAGVS